MPEFYLVSHPTLALLTELALGNPIRTPPQQEALVETCTHLDNPFVDWSHQAGDTWEGTRCPCGRAIPVMADRCGDCARQEARS